MRGATKAMVAMNQVCISPLGLANGICHLVFHQSFKSWTGLSTVHQNKYFLVVCVRKMKEKQKKNFKDELSDICVCVFLSVILFHRYLQTGSHCNLKLCPNIAIFLYPSSIFIACF